MHSKGIAIYFLKVLFKMKRNMVSDIRVGVVTYGQMAFFLTGLERR